MVVDTGGVLNIAKSQADVMEDLVITTTIGIDGIPLASVAKGNCCQNALNDWETSYCSCGRSTCIFIDDGQVWCMTVWIKCIVCLLAIILYKLLNFLFQIPMLVNAGKRIVYLSFVCLEFKGVLVNECIILLYFEYFWSDYSWEEDLKYAKAVCN